ncbi:tol-pal system protein YbgF [Halomonas halocynthiae]|uniref:tol-pal system protein YbgF n=1 Tax=Halomonas halocynthiae TaxID=176290 RepID=UPI000408AB7C|nr:tol-pal system protein YbgF [Halomonas halocynthiae]
MRQCAKYLLTTGAAVSLLALAGNSLAQQPRVDDLTSNSFYDRTVTREEAGGSLALFNATQSNQETIRELRGQIEKLTHELGKLRQQSQQQYMDLDSRLAMLEQGNSAPAASTASQPDSENEQASPSTSSSDAKAAYTAAFSNVQNRKFDAAISAFESFVSDYPDDELVANGYYWLGELYSAKSESDKASDSFQRVINDYPQSGKVPDAIYKLALLKAREGDLKASESLFNQVRNDYPDSSAAGLAKDFMRDSSE